MSTNLTFDHRYHEAEADAEDAPTLLLLHGTGGSPADLIGLSSQLSPRSPILAPAGQVSENGAARWFRRFAEGVFDTEDLVVRTNELADFVAAAREHYGLTGRRTVAVGFSNGANIGAALTLLRPDVLTEAILFAAMAPLPEPPVVDLAGTRVFLSNGDQDPMAPGESTDRLVRDLRERSADVQTHRHPGGHQITVDGLRTATIWLGEKPAPGNTSSTLWTTS